MFKALRFGITWKILSVVFLTALVVVCGMLFLVQWSFDRGFLEYVNRIERETQQNLVAILADEYQRHGDWSFVTDDTRYWRELYLRSFLQSEAGKARLGSGDAERRRPHGHRGKIARGYFKPRIALFDANKEVLIGRNRWNKTNRDSGDKTSFLPVTVNGRTAGFLAVRPRLALSDVHDLRFSRNLGRTFLFSAGLMILISLALALPLSRRLVRPVRELTGATRELAAGNYNVSSAPYGNDELGQLARNFNLLAETLKRNEAARQLWIADISHELRTPISVLRGEIEALQDGVREYSQEKVAGLHQEVLNLGRLVDDLHELSMSDSGALDYRKQDLPVQTILEDCLKQFSSRFAEKNISVAYAGKLAEQDMVFADPNRLRQLFTNLLNNSFDYTDGNGSLQVELVSGNGCINITLEDSAPAVPAEALPRLFERLYRVESSRNRTTGGSGLGLAICRNIAEAHDGSIAASLSTLGGLKILVTLPVSHHHESI